MIRCISLLAATSISVSALDATSDLSLNQSYYDNYANETLFQGDMKFEFKNDIYETTARVEYLYSTEYEKKRYLLLNELYFTKELDSYAITLGKSIKYWGEMEGFNVADIYNQKNYLLDPFDKNAKLGTIGMNVVRYFNGSNVDFGAKFYEENVDYPSLGAPYYPLPVNYDKKLQLSDERITPSLYISYGFATDETVDSESKVIFYHGYDNKRYFIPKDMTTLSQYAYRADKILLLSHIVYEDMIFKFEGAYTNVTKDEQMSDYMQYSIGVEKNFYDVAGNDVTFYLEYYGYKYMDQGKIENIDISEVYDHDLFLALRVDLNDIKNSEIKAGVLYDTDNHEKVFKIEAKSRVFDGLVVDAELLRTITTYDTLLDRLGGTTRATVGITYAF